MPRFDLYLTDEDDKLLRDGAADLRVSRSAYLRNLLQADAEGITPAPSESEQAGE